MKYQGKTVEAYDAFYKACWNAAWQDSGYYSLAQLSAAREEWDDALNEINQSLVRNWHNHRGRHLKAMILRKLGREEEAIKLIEESLNIDKFNFGCGFEAWLQFGEKEMSPSLRILMRNESRNYEELATDYAQAGNWKDALTVVNTALANISVPSTMLLYYKAWFLCQMNQQDEAIRVVTLAEKSPLDEYFPNSLEAILALQCVTNLPVHAPKAFYLLGNIWYDKRQYQEAVNAWERSKEMDHSFPTVLRNLSLAYFNKLGKKKEAVQLLEQAFQLDRTTFAFIRQS